MSPLDILLRIVSARPRQCRHAISLDPRSQSIRHTSTSPQPRRCAQGPHAYWEVPKALFSGAEVLKILGLLFRAELTVHLRVDVCTRADFSLQLLLGLYMFSDLLLVVVLLQVHLILQ